MTAGSPAFTDADADAAETGPVTNGRSTPRARGVWWLAPAGAVSLLTLPTLLLAARTSDVRYRVAWGSPRALTNQTVVLICCGALVFVLAGSLPLLFRKTAVSGVWPDFTPAQSRLLKRATVPLFWLTMSGYLAFGVSGLRNGLTPTGIARAVIGQNVESGDVKDQLARVPGVTSLTQIGIAFVVVATLVLIQHPDRRIRRRLVLTLLLALLRASIVSERLAILELLIPLGAVLALRQMSIGRTGGRVLARMAPALLIPTVLVIFGAFEYSRSWSFYRTRTSIGFPQFVVERFAGYYATAYNNGQLGLTYETFPGRVPYDTIQALWTFPGASLFGGYPSQGGSDPVTRYTEILQLHGSPQFNSPGGLVIPFIDWGLVGGFVYLAVVGAIVGWLYRRCTDGHAFAVVVFPAMTTGLFELPRYIYWTLGRFIPTVIALCVVGYLLTRCAASEGSEAVTHQQAVVT